MADVVDFGSSRRTAADLLALLAGLHKAVEHACESAGIPLSSCRMEETGDGFLISAPEDVGRSAFAGVFLTDLNNELRHHNERHPPGAQIRLRLALNTGEVTRDANRAVSLGIIHTQRLLDSRPLRKALENSTAVLAVIVSSAFYRDFVRQGEEFVPAAYSKVLVNIKQTRDYAWIRLLNDDLPPHRD
jgi:hypothetical protein